MEQPKVAKDGIHKIITVNHVLAAKFGGQEEKAKEILDSLDWSGAALDFQLAKAVMEDRFQDACRIMERIGKKSDFLNENSYHLFPLFRVFRLQKCFRETYEKIFNRPFASKIQETADLAKSELEQEVTKKSDSAIGPLKEKDE